MDLKVQAKPFRPQWSVWDTPRYAISINLKDLQRYAEMYPNIVFVVVVLFEGEVEVRQMTIQRARRLVGNGQAKRINTSTERATHLEMERSPIYSTCET